jgi:hypothetical protein
MDSDPGRCDLVLSVNLNFLGFRIFLAADPGQNDLFELGERSLKTLKVRLARLDLHESGTIG